MALLFDYGGTLDTAACHWSYVLHEGYTQAGLLLTQEAFRPSYVHGERMLAKHPIIQPTDNFRTLLQRKVRIEVEQLEADGYYRPESSAARESLIVQVAGWCDDYARSTVQASAKVLEVLAQRHRLVMVSNFYGNLHAVLADYGILHLFSDVIESAVVGVRKPDPAIWRLGVEAVGQPAESVWAIGDSYGKDVVPASQVGCQTVWFKGREWEDKQYDESVPTRIIRSLSELTEFL